MHSSTSPRRKRFKLLAALGTCTALFGAVAALAASISPARAANIASQADTQVAVFMVPLTLLVLIMLIEAVRFVRRGALPAKVIVRKPHRPPLSQQK